MVSVNDYRVDGSKPVLLGDFDPDDTGDFAGKAEVAELLKADRNRIAELQERLFAEERQSLLIVLQATDTGGKDGTVKKVFGGINPQGCRVWPFREPSEEELSHDILWRYHRRTPAKGMIGIFNRSQYEEVLVVRVKELVPEAVWQRRYDMINDFERMLAGNNTTILKFFLNISRTEQKERLQARLADPAKHWKFSTGDLKDRALWDNYQAAFEDAINRCSAVHAPWIVVPANKKWYRNHVVARTVADTLEAMNPQFPEAEPGLDRVIIPN